MAKKPNHNSSGALLKIVETGKEVMQVKKDKITEKALAILELILKIVLKFMN